MTSLDHNQNTGLPMVEYLDPENDFKFHRFQQGSRFVPHHFISVPRAANFYARSNYGPIYQFYNGRAEIPEQGWSIVWARPVAAAAKNMHEAALQKRQAAQYWLDENRERINQTIQQACTPATSTLYHFAASYHSPTCTQYYDGVIEFPGRIRNEEDYSTLRRMIAEQADYAFNEIRIHSLTVI